MEQCNRQPEQHRANQWNHQRAQHRDRTGNRVANFSAVTGMTLTQSTFALVSEMYADVSFLNFFSILGNPTLYARSIS